MDDFARFLPVASSVGQSVSRLPGLDGLTDVVGVGEGCLETLATIVMPALVARVVDRPVTSMELLSYSYGRVIAVRVTPRATVDPVLPLIVGASSPGYEYWYTRYWHVLRDYLDGPLASRRRLRQMKRRLLAQVRVLLDPRETAFFAVVLEHGALGDYRCNGEAV